jgi:hypothetical protein
VLQHGKRGCNSVVRDHTADRSKTAQYSRSSPAAGELFRPDSSCPPQAGTGQRQRIMAQLGPASMHGDPLQVANHSPRCFRQRGPSSYLFPPRMTNSTSSLRGVGTASAILSSRSPQLEKNQAYSATCRQ